MDIKNDLKDFYIVCTIEKLISKNIFLMFISLKK